MSLGIFICVCVAIMVIDTINDPKFKEKIKNLEEECFTHYIAMTQAFILQCLKK